MSSSLPDLVDRAAAHLAGARTAAEILDARDHAAVAYDMARRAGRLAAARGAYDELIPRIHRAQADALVIEAEAKRRLADEYDAAQERGEVARNGGDKSRIPEQNSATVAEIGLTHKIIHESRKVRDAEKAAPGLVRRTVDAALAAGAEPTRAEVRRAVEKAAPKRAAAATRKPAPPRRAAICMIVREAVAALAGLPPASEVAGYFRGTDHAILVDERLTDAARWLADFARAWRSDDA